MTDEAHVSVEVEIAPAAAFDVFTRETGAWWRADRSLHGGDGPVTFEPGVGGLVRDGDAEVGRVKVWEPGPRLVFGYGDTDVEVRFEGTDTGTRVVLRHYGWGRRPGHWQGLLASFARHSLEHALLGRLGEFLDAIGAGDIDFFERNLTDDALLIFPGAGQHLHQGAVRRLDGATTRPTSSTTCPTPRIVHIGESTAVLTHHATVMHTADEKPRSIVVATVLVQRGRRLADGAAPVDPGRRNGVNMLGYFAIHAPDTGARQGLLHRRVRLDLRLPGRLPPHRGLLAGRRDHPGRAADRAVLRRRRRRRGRRQRERGRHARPSRRCATRAGASRSRTGTAAGLALWQPADEVPRRRPQVRRGRPLLLRPARRGRRRPRVLGRAARLGADPGQPRERLEHRQRQPARRACSSAAPGATVLYFHVADVDATAERIRAAGGTAGPPQPNQAGAHAACRDDQGIAFGIGSLRQK